MSCLKNVIFILFYFLAFNTSTLLSLLLTKLVFGSALQCGGRGGLPTRALPERGGPTRAFPGGGPTRAFPVRDPQEHFRGGGGGDPQEHFLVGTHKSIFFCCCCFLLSLFVTLYIFLHLTVMHSSTFGKGLVGMSACPLVVLACESLHVCTVCIWRCEHARFCVEFFYALYINFHSFIPQVSVSVSDRFGDCRK